MATIFVRSSLRPLQLPPCCVRLFAHAYSEARPGDLIHGEAMDATQISGNRTSARSPSGCRVADCASYPLTRSPRPGQRWECSHAVIKDHPPRRYRRLEQPPCSGDPAHKVPGRAGTRNPRDYRVPDPVSIQLAAGVDDLGYGLATGSAATREGTRGFLPRRTFCLRPGCGTRPLAWIPTGGTCGLCGSTRRDRSRRIRSTSCASGWRGTGWSILMT